MLVKAYIIYVKGENHVLVLVRRRAEGPDENYRIFAKGGRAGGTSTRDNARDLLHNLTIPRPGPGPRAERLTARAAEVPTLEGLPKSPEKVYINIFKPYTSKQASLASTACLLACLQNSEALGLLACNFRKL